MNNDDAVIFTGGGGAGAKLDDHKTVRVLNAATQCNFKLIPHHFTVHSDKKKYFL
jgi:hypothetical protein